MSRILSQLLIPFALFITLSAEAAQIIRPDHPFIHYTGVVQRDITPSRAKLYRFVENYRNRNGGGYWLSTKAGNQAGMTLRFRTASPTVKLTFEADPNYETRWGAMALYRNGELIQSHNTAPDDGYEISVTGQANELADYVLTFPGWQPMWLKTLELSNGYHLNGLNNVNKPLYVAIGDSITHGVGQTGNGTHLSYVWQLAEGLGYDSINLAIGGSKINPEILENLSDIEPDLITILWGYNDLHGDWPLSKAEDKFETLLTALVEGWPSTTIKVILPTYTDNTVGDKNPSNTLENLEAFQTRIVEALANQHPNLSLTDGSFYTDASSLADEVHLNDAGAASLAAGLLSEFE